MPQLTLAECEALMFASYERVHHTLSGYDSQTRDLTGMRELFARASIPSQLAPTITVTGSKGKGSTSILCSALLQGMGYRVGLMTSPHFLSLRERIRLDGTMIGAEDFTAIVNGLAPHIREVDAALPPGKYLSPTGLFLAVAMLYFQGQGADALVLEVGRGGRFDDISLIENRIACFTPIMAEHLDKLGPTVPDVAWNKAGIIKPGGIAITAPQTEDVNAVLIRECAEHGALLWQVGGHINYRKDGQTVALEAFGNTARFALNTPAEYQALNLSVAYGAVVAFDPSRLNQPDVAAKVAAVRLPGRCDLVSREPLVIVDGAINRESAQQFRDSVAHLARRPLVLVTALPHDKDFAGLLETLVPLVDHTLITRVSAGHLHFTDQVYTVARTLSEHVTDQPDVMRAFETAVEMAGTQGTIWVVGTQSLVRDALSFWRQDLTTL